MAVRRFGLIQELKIDLLILGLCVLACSMCYVNADDLGTARRVIRILQTSGDSPDTSNISSGAVKYLETEDADALPHILNAMKGQPLTIVNWLRCAFDTIANREMASGGRRIDLELLQRIAEDRSHSGHARRLALELWNRLVPGTSHQFLLSRLDDEEFGADAVDEALTEAVELKASGDTAGAIALLKAAFSGTIQPEQTRTTAARLKELGELSDVSTHLGIVRNWKLVGPFPGRDMKGVTEVYPPEKSLDLTAEYEGKSGTITWKSVELTKEEEWLDFKKLIGDVDDSVAYVATTVVSPNEREVELRAGADDNLQLWLNGECLLRSTEFHQRIRTDRHRVKARLHQGSNTIIAKVCEAKVIPGPTSGSPARWQFGLRIVDSQGRGISFPTN